MCGFEIMKSHHDFSADEFSVNFSCYCTAAQGSKSKKKTFSTNVVHGEFLELVRLFTVTHGST